MFCLNLRKSNCQPQSYLMNIEVSEIDHEDNSRIVLNVQFVWNKDFFQVSISM